MTPSTDSNTLQLPSFSGETPARHCKIVGTLGPSSSDEKTLTDLIESGLNVVRLNFSHGDHEFHKKNIDLVRKVSQKTGIAVGILQDLQGPKIRCGQLLNGRMNIVGGETYKLEYGTDQTDNKTVPIDYKELVRDVKVGQRVMMDDGLLIFKITKIEGSTVEVTAEEGGELKNRKGVNFPDALLSLPALTEKDSKDLIFGISNGVDYVALSFVQKPEDIISVKEMLKALGSDVPIIAKIEKLSAVEQIDAIAKEAGGLMVARGDLGVEANVERVPGFQKKILAAGMKHLKPVIIATQMLESMIQNPRATLAEIADVANGVLDGADCLMLSGEVAAGKYPVECVRKMASIIEEVEAWTLKNEVQHPARRTGDAFDVWPDHEAIAIAACEAAKDVGAKAIVCLSLTGNIAKTIAHWRPSVPIIALSPREDIIRRLIFVWGVYGLKNPLFYKTDDLLQALPKLIKEMGILNSGDIIVITAGIPISKMCATNMIKINQIP